jgi:hypothetical protein
MCTIRLPGLNIVMLSLRWNLGETCYKFDATSYLDSSIRLTWSTVMLLCLYRSSTAPFPTLILRLEAFTHLREQSLHSLLVILSHSSDLSKKIQPRQESLCPCVILQELPCFGVFCAAYLIAMQLEFFDGSQCLVLCVRFEETVLEVEVVLL